MALLIFAAAVIVAAVFLMARRRADVRLVLLGAGLLMATAAGRPIAVLDRFTAAMVAEMVAPICAAMGFAAVLTATGCDRHLVHLLLRPVRRVPWALIPGGVAAAYVVNVAVPSQASTAAAVGPVLVPLLLAAGVRPAVAGAALVLGSSFGGDLLNPAAQDVVATAAAAKLDAAALSARVIPASLAGLVVAACAFALLNRRHLSASGVNVPPSPSADDTAAERVAAERVAAETSGLAPPSRLNVIKAVIPLVPVTLLLVAYAGWGPLQWLRRVPDGEGWDRLRGALPVVRAMLLGTLLAAAVGWRDVQALTARLFDGMGAAYAGIISLTITAQCFGAGVEAAGVSRALVSLLDGSGVRARALAVGFPWAMATLSGSGSGPVLTFAQTLLAGLGPAYEPVTLGAAACLAGAFGRTMSPVAAVVIYSSGLAGVPPLAVVRPLVPALLAGAVVALSVAILRG